MQDKPMYSKVVATRVFQKLCPMYKVLLHNDDENDMDFVVYALQEVFKYPKQDCRKIMLDAHLQGVAVCKVEHKEVAELHCEQLQSFGLVSSIEPDK